MPSRGGRHTPALTMTAARLDLLARFQERCALGFRDPALLDRALTHSSCINENSGQLVNNETLEFLGDAVLGQVVAHFLYRALDGKPEGVLSRAKSWVVSEASLAPVSEAIGIADILRMGKGEELSGGRKKKAILADALEAVFGALFIDSGYAAAETFIESVLSERLREAISAPARDFKSMLQEWAQKTKGQDLPVYSIIKAEGPQHDHVFVVSCTVREGESSIGRGKTRKAAEQDAARSMLASLGLPALHPPVVPED